MLVFTKRRRTPYDYLNQEEWDAVQENRAARGPVQEERGPSAPAVSTLQAPRPKVKPRAIPYGFYEPKDKPEAVPDM